MIKKILISVFIISIIFFGLLKYRSYGFEKSLNGRPKESSWLINDFNSYQSFNSVKNQLRRDGFKWKITNRINDEYLGYKYNYFNVRVKDFKTNNVRGNLELSFFNDRLQGIDFISNNIDTYKTILKKNKKVEFTNSNEAKVLPRTIIIFRGRGSYGNDNFYNNPFVEIFDTQISDEADFWLNKSGSALFGP